MTTPGTSTEPTPEEKENPEEKEENVTTPDPDTLEGIPGDVPRSIKPSPEVAP